MSLVVRRRRSRIAVAALAILTAALAVACGSAPNYAAGGSSSDQQQYQIKLAADRSSLIAGSITLPNGVSGQTSNPVRVSVTVCGPRAIVPGLCGRLRTSTASGDTPANQVMTGANLKVDLTTDVQSTITLTTDEIQPVVSPTDDATWVWNVVPHQATSADEFLTVHVTALIGQTTNPLIPERTFTIPFDVATSGGDTRSHIGNTLQWLLTTLGALAALAVAAFTLRDRIKKMFQRKDKKVKKQTKAPKKAMAGQKRK